MSQLLNPICLTREGDYLRGVNGTTLETDALPQNGVIGVHEICGGNVCRRPTSRSYSSLFCGECGLRLIVPRGILTYSELRHWFGSLQSDL